MGCKGHQGILGLTTVSFSNEIEFSLPESGTSMCDSVVVHVRVWSGPELGFGRTGSAWGDGEGCIGERGGPGQGQWLSVVFKRAKLSVQLLQFFVLLCLQVHHLFDVSTKEKSLNLKV